MITECITPKILLIENNQTNAYIFDKVWAMVHPPEDLIRVGSSQGALAYLCEKDHMHNIEVIFLEFDLPVHNGKYFLGKFEELYRSWKKKPKVVITTSHLSWTIVELSRKYSFISNVMEKPIRVESLKGLY